MQLNPYKWIASKLDSRPAGVETNKRLKDIGAVGLILSLTGQAAACNITRCIVYMYFKGRRKKPAEN